MQIDFDEFKNGATEFPKKDGEYLVIGFFRNTVTYASVTYYTVKYGWNTFVDSKGVPHTQSKMTYDNDGDHRYFWCECPVKEVGDTNGTIS